MVPHYNLGFTFIILHSGFYGLTCEESLPATYFLAKVTLWKLHAISHTPYLCFFMPSISCEQWGTISSRSSLSVLDQS